MKPTILVFSFLFLTAFLSHAESPVDPHKDIRAEPPGAPRETPVTPPSPPPVKPKAEASEKKAATITPAYTATIKQLMHVTHADKNQEDIIDQIATNLSKDAKDRAKAKKSAYDFFYKVISVEALLPDIAQTYSQYFNLAELKKLVAFYKSPLGQKAASKMPEITREMMMKNSVKMQVKMAEFQKEKSKMAGFQPDAKSAK